jgi:hypothetical protein
MSVIYCLALSYINNCCVWYLLYHVQHIGHVLRVLLLLMSYILSALSLTSQIAVFFSVILLHYIAFWTVHLLKVNEKPTNAVILQCIDTRHSPIYFGTLKCHHQGVNHDPAEIGAQCCRNQRWMEVVYCSRWRDGQDMPTLGTYLSRNMIDSLMMAS